MAPIYRPPALAENRRFANAHKAAPLALLRPRPAISNDAPVYGPQVDGRELTDDALIKTSRSNWADSVYVGPTSGDKRAGPRARGGTNGICVAKQVDK